MVEKGVVSGLNKGRLIVNIERHAACAGCKACNVASGRLMAIEVDNTIGAKIGDRVNIELDDSIFLKTALLFYLLPLLGFIFGVFIGSVSLKGADLILPNEVLSTLFGVLIMVIILLGVRKYSRTRTQRYRPRISKA